MAMVWIPALMRNETGGKEKVVVSGSTLRQVVNNLLKQYPGLKQRLMDGDQISPMISVAIDGALISMGLLEEVKEDSEVTFIPRVSGGTA
jgi:molybdopterin converting factor small subunit